MGGKEINPRERERPEEITITQRAKGDKYYKDMVKVLKTRFAEIRDEHDTLEDFLKENSLTDRREAVMELPKSVLIAKSGANRQTCYQNSLFWKMEDLSGVKNMYQKGRMRINIPDFIEGELDGFPGDTKNKETPAHTRNENTDSSTETQETGEPLSETTDNGDNPQSSHQETGEKTGDNTE